MKFQNYFTINQGLRASAGLAFVGTIGAQVLVGEYCLKDAGLSLGENLGILSTVTAVVSLGLFALGAYATSKIAQNGEDASYDIAGPAGPEPAGPVGPSTVLTIA